MTNIARNPANRADDEIAAFEALMRQHNRRLYRTARSILRHDGDAEDCVQEAFLHAWRHRDQFRGEAAPSTWLTRIVINEALMKLRRNKAAAGTVALDNVVDLDAHVEASVAGMQRLPGPDAEALRHELCALLERKIDALPQSFRTVFMLRAIEEMSAEETAQCLGIPEATVRTRLFRARSLLRESIASDVDLALASAFEFMGERCDRIVAGVLAAIRREAAGSPDASDMISKETK
jgi:RNA polymerase sigma-70 factor (ECF subfamily)